MVKKATTAKTKPSPESKVSTKSKTSNAKSSSGNSSGGKASSPKPSSQKPKGKADAIKKAGTGTKAQSKARGGKNGLVSQSTAGEMMRLLRKRYPDAECELTYKNDFELLISVILSAQTTDVQVNKVTPKLFQTFPTAKALAEADIEDVKEIIKATGYYNNKAKTIQGCAQALVGNFGSTVPCTLDELVTLPGVGRKTANVVLGVIHKIPGWAVDTHVQRLSKRMGLTVNEDPLKIEVDLQNIYPDQDWSLYGITMIFHGRRLCYARNPECHECPINHLCPSSLV